MQQSFMLGMACDRKLYNSDKDQLTIFPGSDCPKFNLELSGSDCPKFNFELLALTAESSGQ